MGKKVHVILERDGTRVNCSHCGWVNGVNDGTRLACSVSRRRNNGRTPYNQAVKGDSCEACGSTSFLCLDHDHACCPGKARKACGNCFRGTLCRRCNVALGLLEGMGPDAVRNLLQYIKKAHQSND